MPAFLRSLLISAAGASVACALPVAVKAHAIESTLQYLNGNLQLRSSFSTGSPAAGATVRLLQADGSAGQELGRMDADGTLKLSLPALEQGTLDVQIDGGPGHRDYLALPIRRGKVQIDAVSQSQPLHHGLMALLGGAGVGLGLFGGAILVGRVRRSRIG